MHSARNISHAHHLAASEGASPRVVIRLPDLATADAGAVFPAIRTAEDGSAPIAEGIESAPVRPPEAETAPAASQRVPPAELRARPRLALLVDNLTRRSRSTLASLSAVYFVLQQPKAWLAIGSALAVQVIAPLLFHGAAEPGPSKAPPAWSARQLPATAGSPAGRSADAGPVEIVVPQPDGFESPSRALGAEQDPAMPNYEMAPAGETAPLEVDLARQPPQSDDPALRVAIRPHVWPAFKSGATIEPGVATLRGIEPLDSAAGDSAINGRQP
jgi:hypothetical protein